MDDPNTITVPPTPPATPPRHWIRGGLSALVPGLGQLAAGRIVDGVLFLAATLWMRLFFTGLAADEDRLSAALVGAFGITGGLGRPTAVVFTVLAVTLHVIAAWDAARPRDRAGLALKRAGEV